MDQRQRLLASALWSAKYVSISIFREKISSKAEAGFFSVFGWRLLAIWQQSFWLRCENSYHCVKRFFLRKYKFLMEMFSFYKWCTLSVKRPNFWLSKEDRVFKASFCVPIRMFWGKKCLKKYSMFNFLGIKKMGRLAKKNIVEFWNVDDMCQKITSEETKPFEIKCFVLYIWSMLSIQLPIFWASQMGRVVGSAFLVVITFSSLLLHFDILCEKPLNL